MCETLQKCSKRQTTNVEICLRSRTRENSQEAWSACNVRRESNIALKKAFGSSEIVAHKSFYDNRTCIDPITGIEYVPWMFSKTLEHDPVTGFAKKADVDKIVDAWELGTKESNEMIPQSTVNTLKLENPQTSNSFNLMGLDPTIPCIEPQLFTQVDSEAGFFEMMEVYSLQLHRDTSFDDITKFDASHPHIVALNKFQNKASVRDTVFTGQTLYRCKCVDERVGPHISQPMLLPFKYGNLMINQMYDTEGDTISTLQHSSWLDIQNKVRVI